MLVSMRQDGILVRPFHLFFETNSRGRQDLNFDLAVASVCGARPLLDFL
jgi:hypothetical protein